MPCLHCTIVVPSCADAYRRSIPPSRPVLNASMATFHSTCRRSRTSSSKSWGERNVKVYRDIEYSLVQIPDLALRRRECIFDRDHDVLVFGRVAMSLADEDILMLRDRDANIDREQLAFAAPHRRCDGRHVTTRYPVVEFFQPLGLSFSDRIVSEGSEFWKVISSGTCRETFPLRHFQS